MSPGEAAPSPKAAGPGGCGRVCARPDVPTAPGAGSPAGRVISSPPQGTRRARGRVAMSPPCLITRLPPLPEGSRVHASSRGGSDNPSRALTKEPRAVGWLAGTVGGVTGSVAPEDAAPRGAGGRGLGGLPCLVWILEGRPPRALGGGRARRAGAYGCCCCRVSCRAGSAGALPAGCWPGLLGTSGNPLSTG